MFGGLKKMLGIEDVKIELILPDAVNQKNGIIKGIIKLSSFKDSAIESISIKLIEKYIRGRNDSKLIDEYIVGFIDLDEHIEIQKQDVIEIPFELPFKVSKSEIDRFEDRNFVFAGLAKIAKTLKGVKSEYRVQAEAFVKGTKLSPLAVKSIVIK
jgi:hypothetical protein